MYKKPSCRWDSRPYCLATCIFVGGEEEESGPPLWKIKCPLGSATVPLDRAFVSSYRLSIVTMPPSQAAVWLQFATQVFGREVSTPV